MGLDSSWVSLPTGNITSLDRNREDRAILGFLVCAISSQNFLLLRSEFHELLLFRNKVTLCFCSWPYTLAPWLAVAQEHQWNHARQFGQHSLETLPLGLGQQAISPDNPARSIHMVPQAVKEGSGEPEQVYTPMAVIPTLGNWTGPFQRLSTWRKYHARTQCDTIKRTTVHRTLFLVMAPVVDEV